MSGGAHKTKVSPLSLKGGTPLWPILSSMAPPGVRLKMGPASLPLSHLSLSLPSLRVSLCFWVTQPKTEALDFFLRSDF
jgi:hypothetical protein